MTGLVASAVGAAAGIGLAVGLRSLVAAFGFDLPGSGVVIQASSIWLPIVVGVGLTTIAAYLPARRAGSLPPLAAIRAVDQRPSPAKWRYIVGATLGVVGLVIGLLGVPLVLIGATCWLLWSYRTWPGLSGVPVPASAACPESSGTPMQHATRGARPRQPAHS